ncbi:solute carrier family 2, facilitated glucose transporter member 2-like [Paramacrobiotus metropolitanus]|uniref:solute carrier family 2, facilitated glucose transporter member 2-like n=1 Tax=Paramacrobiotus metropolitanus TaxID=2943436 RepID=UPI0024464D32|nr:solute carrier family 2, facilitated glucose transporter member 2-like [Paramacrobiotus metropolitanus]
MGQKAVAVNRDPLTATTFFASLMAALSTWFAGGYIAAQVNVPQDLIINWIRQIECARITDHFATVGVTSMNDTQTNAILWCFANAENETSLHLRENGKLGAIWSMVGCGVMLGVSVGALVTNYLVEGLGFRRTLLLCNLLEMVGSLTAGFSVAARSHELFIAGRLIFGLGNGFGCSACGVYVSEISPDKHRGALNVVVTASFSIGVLIADIVGLPQILGTSANWQHMSWILLLPSILFVVSYYFLPESPRWLCRKMQHTGKTESTLQRLRGRQNVEADIRLIESELEEARKLTIYKISMLDLFRDGFLRKTTAICLLAIAAQRFTGYLAVYVYSTEMFRQCGITKALASYGTIILTALSAVIALLGSRLLDIVGRRIMLLGGLFGCSLCTAAMVAFAALTKYEVCFTCQYGNLVAMILFMVFFALGPASVPFLLPAEMFGMTSRQSASALTYIVCLSISTIITAVFPIMQAHLMEWTFTIFTGVTATLTIFLSKMLIETKGKSFLEIQKALEDRFCVKRKGSREPIFFQCTVPERNSFSEK